MVSLTFSSQFQQTFLHLFWSPEERDCTLLSEPLLPPAPWLSSSGTRFWGPPPAMLLMCSDTQDAGRGCAFSMRHDRNASYNHKLAPTNSASDIIVRQAQSWQEAVFMGKWQQGQQNFISEANLCFVPSCPCLEVPPRPKYLHSMKNKLQFLCLKI